VGGGGDDGVRWRGRGACWRGREAGQSENASKMVRVASLTSAVGKSGVGRARGWRCVPEVSAGHGVGARREAGIDGEGEPSVAVEGGRSFEQHWPSFCTARNSYSAAVPTPSQPLGRPTPRGLSASTRAYVYVSRA
jgi:hypothetical protein